MLRLLAWFLAFVLAIAGVQAIQRQFDNELAPSWTYQEYVRRLENINEKRDFVFLGDSRAGWGIPENTITDVLRACGINASAWNLGHAGGGLKNLSETFLANTGKPAGGTTILAYSPAFLFHFEGGRGGRRPEQLVRFNVVDERVIQVAEKVFRGNLKDLPLRLTKLLKGEPPSPRPYWADRTVYTEGFVQGTLLHTQGKPIDLSKFQLEYYTEIVNAIRSNTRRRNERLADFVNVINRIQDAGWKVAMMRLPVGPEMRKIESQLPPEATFSMLVDALGLAAIDYNNDARTVGLKTSDESHLTPQSAQAIGTIIGRDLAEFNGSSCAPTGGKEPGAVAALPKINPARPGSGIMMLTDLPTLAGSSSTQVAWDGLAGLKVYETKEQPVVRGQPVLQLISQRAHDVRRIGMRLSGVTANQVYRVTAWVKPGTENSVLLSAADDPWTTRGTVTFFLNPNKIDRQFEQVLNRGLEQEPDGWVKLWLELKPQSPELTAFIALYGFNPPASLTFGGMTFERRAD